MSQGAKVAKTNLCVPYGVTRGLPQSRLITPVKEITGIIKYLYPGQHLCPAQGQ